VWDLPAFVRAMAAVAALIEAYRQAGLSRPRNRKQARQARRDEIVKMTPTFG
jgi:hypothetical protein